MKRITTDSLFASMPAKMLAGLVANNFQFEEHKAGFVANGMLQEREATQLDETVTEVARAEFNVYADFQANRMVTPLGGLGVMLSQWEKRTHRGEAKRSMSVLERGQNDQPNYSLNAVPIPVIFDEFTLDARNLAASRQRGAPLDTVNAQDATKNVVESVEDLIVNGDANITVNGYPIYGLTTHPNRVTESLTAAWSNTQTRDPVRDILKIKQELYDVNQRGNFMVYMCSAYATALLDDYNSTSGKTLIERMTAVPGCLGIKVSDKVAAGSVVAVVMSPSTVDFGEAQPLINVPWEEQGGLGLHQKVMLAGAPRFRVDASNQLGVVHLSA